MSYNKVIPILKNELDWKTICFEIAAEHPEIFLEAYGASHPDKLRDIVIQALENNPCRKIQAIKECRSVSSMDLKTAKEYVEKIMEELGI